MPETSGWIAEAPFLAARRRGRETARSTRSPPPPRWRGARMLMMRSNWFMVRRTESRGPASAASATPRSAQSCSFWTWQWGQRVAAPGGASAPEPVHRARGARIRGSRRSRDVPFPATYDTSGGASGSSSGTSSSRRYHRRAETHGHSAHAPSIIVREVDGAGRGRSTGETSSGVCSAAAKRTARGSPTAGSTATGPTEDMPPEITPDV